MTDKSLRLWGEGEKGGGKREGRWRERREEEEEGGEG